MTGRDRCPVTVTSDWPQIISVVLHSEINAWLLVTPPFCFQPFNCSSGNTDVKSQAHGRKPWPLALKRRNVTAR